MSRDYFSQYPKISFRRENDSLILPANKQAYYDIPVTDIFVKFKIRDAFISNANLFYPYVWKDGDRPDTIAERYYGSDKFHWVVFYSNGAFDLNYDFPMTPTVFLKYLKRKYSSFVTTEAIDSGKLLSAPTLEAAEAAPGTYQGFFFRVPSGPSFLYYDWVNYPLPKLLSNDDYTIAFLEKTISHYEIEEKYIVDAVQYSEAIAEGDTTAREVSILTKEIEENEEKRNIQLLDNDYFRELVKSFRESMNSVKAER